MTAQTPDTMEAVRNWLGTGGGLVALAFAANTYRRNVRDKREAQARLVYASTAGTAQYEPNETFEMLPNEAVVGNTAQGFVIRRDLFDPVRKVSFGMALTHLQQYTIAIHNGSKELIGPIKVQLVAYGPVRRPIEQVSITISHVEPESEKRVDFTWINEAHPGFPSISPTILFRDSSGQWWRRFASEPIERVHDDPENDAFGTPTERAAFRRIQEALGIEEKNRVPEPKITERVRWHRNMRVLRGRPPIP